MKLVLITTQKQKNGETKYIYHNQDNISFHLEMTKKPWIFKTWTSCLIMKNKTNQIIETFVKNGINQHSYKNGFKDAISILEVI